MAEDEYPSSMNIPDEERFAIPLGLFGPSTNWMMPAYVVEGGFSLLSLLIQMLISSGNNLTYVPGNNFY